jgi:AcrR family transcriptional regulator
MQPRERKPGRPTEADTAHILDVSLRLFEQHGFEAVTMDQIAKASSVSRRTLFRHFPSKSDLVWEGANDSLGALKSLAAPLAPKSASLARIVDELFVPVLVMLDDPAIATLARRRLALIADAPALLNHPTLREIERIIASAIAPSALPKKVPPALVARALVASLFASLQWWAVHGAGMRAHDATLGALHAIASASTRNRR